MDIKTNSAINLVGYVIPMLVMLITIPLYLNAIGVERYGVLALVWLIIGYAMFMEIGLGKATATEIAKIELHAFKAKSEIFWTSIYVNLFLGAIAALLVGIIGGYLIQNIFIMSDSIREEASSSLVWIVTAVPVALISSVLNSSLEAVNKFALLNKIQVTGNILFHVIPLLIAINYSSKLDDVIAASIIVRLALIITLLYFCIKYVVGNIFTSFKKEQAKKLLSYGKWIGLSTMIAPALETFDRAIIGATIGPAGVSFYTVAYQLTSRIRIIPSAISRALLPPLSAASNESAININQNSYIAIAKFMTPLLIAIGLFLKFFVFLWVGSEIALHVLPVSYIFLIGMLANSICIVPVTYLIASKKAKILSIVYLYEIIPFIFLVYLLSYKWGVVGAAIAWVARVFADLIIMSLIAGLQSSLIKISLSIFLSTTSLMALYFWNIEFLSFDIMIILVGICLVFSIYNVRHDIKSFF